MTRIAIIGNAGGGKSTLARKLGEALSMPVYEVDRVQWKPGWVRAPLEEVKQAQDLWLESPQWIIDGWGSWDVLATRFENADTIIFVDLPIAQHYWWAIKRQVTCMFQSNASWPPPGCPALPVTGRLLKLMWQIHRDYRPKLLELIDQFRNKKDVVLIRSTREMDSFVSRSLITNG